MADIRNIYEDDKLRCVGIFRQKNGEFFAANTYIFVNKKTMEACVIDTGTEDNDLYMFLDENNYKVTKVIYTHLHHDHILGYYKAKFVFNDVPFVMSQVDGEHVNDMEYTLFDNKRKQPNALKAPSFPNSVYVKKANEYTNEFVEYGKDIVLDEYICDMQTISIAGFDAIVFETPGHTKGSICIMLLDFPIVITGDTIFREAVGRYDLKSGSFQDLRESIHKILDREDITNSHIFLPGHGGITNKYDFERWYMFSGYTY